MTREELEAFEAAHAVKLRLRGGQIEIKGPPLETDRALEAISKGSKEVAAALRERQGFKAEPPANGVTTTVRVVPSQPCLDPTITTSEQAPEPVELSAPNDVELGIAGGVIPTDAAGAYKLGFAHGQLARSAAATKTPDDLDIQLAAFKTWQSQRGELWIWPPEAMAALTAKLVELGDGVEIIPTFALSVAVKLPSGRTISIDRQGRETP